MWSMLDKVTNCRPLGTIDQIIGPGSNNDLMGFGFGTHECFQHLRHGMFVAVVSCCYDAMMSMHQNIWTDVQRREQRRSRQGAKTAQPGSIDRKSTRLNSSH